MAIVGNNALLNQYVPTFYIKDLQDGQTLRFDARRKAFVNAEGGTGTGGVDRLGELLDVSDSLNNPLALQNGQALVYNSATTLWESKFIDYNTLINKPVISSENSPITISGDATGTGTSSIPLILNDVNLTPGTYGTDHLVPTITVNSKGLVTSITTRHVDTTVRDLVPAEETIVVAPRHQYIVTGVLEIEGLFVNNGVTAIL